MGLFIILKELYSADKPVTELYKNKKFNDLEKNLITNNFSFNFHKKFLDIIYLDNN